jgi:hypothetical protein
MGSPDGVPLEADRILGSVVHSKDFNVPVDEILNKYAAAGSGTSSLKAGRTTVRSMAAGSVMPRGVELPRVSQTISTA